MRSARRRALLVASFLVVPAVVLAQSPGKPAETEIGFIPLAVSSISSGDHRVTVVGAPAGGFQGTVMRGMYAQWFVREKVAIEPQLSVTAFFGDGDARLISLALRANYLLQGSEKPSPYVFGGGGLWHVGGVSSETNPLIHLGVGYRQPIRTAGSVRVEAGYEHLFGESAADIFTVSLGLGLRF